MRAVSESLTANSPRLTPSVALVGETQVSGLADHRPRLRVCVGIRHNAADVAARGSDGSGDEQ